MESNATPNAETQPIAVQDAITAPAGETPPSPEEAPKEAKPDAVSPQFAALAKRDKLLTKKAQEIAAQEKAIKEREEKIKAESTRWEEAKKVSDTDPLKALEMIGLKDERVVEAFLGKTNPTVDTKLDALNRRLERWEQQLQEREENAKKQAAEAERKRNDEVITNFKDSIGQFVESKGEDYELLRTLEEQGVINVREMVFTGIQTVHADRGTIPTIKEAADGVQEYLKGVIENSLGKVKYFKDKYAAKMSSAPAETQKTPDGANANAKTTITNSMSTAATSLPAMTEEQRIRRALQAMEDAEKS